MAQNANGTTTCYLGGLEERTDSRHTKYYTLPGLSVSAVNVGGTISYLATDGLSSVSAAFDQRL